MDVDKDDVNFRMADCCDNCQCVRGWRVTRLKTCSEFRLRGFVICGNQIK
jgi:hypothetical protein